MLPRTEANRPQYAYFNFENREAEKKGFILALNVVAPWANVWINMERPVVHCGERTWQIEWQLIERQ
ncbi:MAG: hypothetical protein Unbinned3992contig1000_34 [Prokaryotic dsDNA virus sp.]|nr:MAG: hypothetical protein Unbinned3992contig1000_34 [Prokaryotic dsDNA virus sp.]|tara:strand:+ start:4056 stop:4256 length:201 start_codon:yes stop_codon:yes gene_type:complete